MQGDKIRNTADPLNSLGVLFLLRKTTLFVSACGYMVTQEALHTISKSGCLKSIRRYKRVKISLGRSINQLLLHPLHAFIEG